jgi:hypothetical protein
VSWHGASAVPRKANFSVAPDESPTPMVALAESGVSRPSPRSRTPLRAGSERLALQVPPAVVR